MGAAVLLDQLQLYSDSQGYSMYVSALTLGEQSLLDINLLAGSRTDNLSLQIDLSIIHIYPPQRTTEYLCFKLS
jgi:hypothetical protein